MNRFNLKDCRNREFDLHIGSFEQFKIANKITGYFEDVESMEDYFNQDSSGCILHIKGGEMVDWYAFKNVKDTCTFVEFSDFNWSESRDDLKDVLEYEKKRFNLDNYNGKYVMHFQTETEYDKFSRFLDDNGKRWKGDENYTKLSYWKNTKEAICIHFAEGQHGSIEFYIDKGFVILEYSDFDWSEKPIVLKFEVGNYAKLSEKCDKDSVPTLLSDMKPRKIKALGSITNTGLFVELEGARQAYFSFGDLDIVEEPAKEWKPIQGGRYEFSDFKDFSQSVERMFYANDKEFDYPYSVICENREREYKEKKYIETGYYKFIREIQPKYKAYDLHDDFEMCWIGEEILSQDKNKYVILGVFSNKLIIGSLIDRKEKYKLTTPIMISDGWLWEDGNKPFGKEVE